MCCVYEIQVPHSPVLTILVVEVASCRSHERHRSHSIQVRRPARLNGMVQSPDSGQRFLPYTKQHTARTGMCDGTILALCLADLTVVPIRDLQGPRLVRGSYLSNESAYGSEAHIILCGVDCCPVFL